MKSKAQTLRKIANYTKILGTIWHEDIAQRTPKTLKRIAHDMKKPKAACVF